MYLTNNRPSATYILVNETNPPGEFTFNGRSVALFSINGNEKQYEIRWKVRATTTDKNDLEAIEHYKLEPAYEICAPKGFIDLRIIGKEEQQHIHDHLVNVLKCHNERYTPEYMKKKPCDKAHLMEWTFLQAVSITLKTQGKQMPPAWSLCLMSGRSLFTI